MIHYSIRSAQQLMEQMWYNLLFHWFVGFGIGDPVWDEERPETCPMDRFQTRTREALGRRPVVSDPDTATAC